MSFALTVTLRARAGEEERVAVGVSELAVASRLEPGVIEWRVHHSTDDPRLFLLYELYYERDGLDVHRDTEHFRTYQRDILPLIEERQAASWETLLEEV